MFAKCAVIGAIGERSVAQCWAEQCDLESLIKGSEHGSRSIFMNSLYVAI